MKRDEYDISCYDENLKDYVTGLWIEISRLKGKISKRNMQIKDLRVRDDKLKSVEAYCKGYFTDPETNDLPIAEEMKHLKRILNR